MKIWISALKSIKMILISLYVIPANKSVEMPYKVYYTPLFLHEIPEPNFSAHIILQIVLVCFWRKSADFTLSDQLIFRH